MRARDGMPARMRFLVLTILLGGCEARVSLGTPCAESAACSADLACTAGRCRSGCTDARDCESTLACVLDAHGVGACEVVEDESCGTGCVEPLVCVGERCVQPCDEPQDCAAGQVCAAGICARASSAPCDPLTGSGCEAGRRCEVQLDGSLVCAAVTVRAEQMRALGETCSVTDACEAGLTCQGERCVRWCLRDAASGEPQSSCGPGSRCFAGDEVGAPRAPPGFGYCSQTCDPVGGAGCIEAHFCDVVYSTPLRTASCRFPQGRCDGAPGDPGCVLGDSSAGCAPAYSPSFVLNGTGLAGALVEWLCLELCERDSDCAGGYRCLTETLVAIEDLDRSERVLGACLPACVDGACPSEATALGLACEASGTYCTAGCERDDDCYPTLRCMDGRCTPR